MTVTWKKVRVQAVAAGQVDEQAVAQARDSAIAAVRAYRLAELRRELGFNQASLARRLGISQSRVSRIERGDLDHTEIATLRAFTEALGGELEITVRLGDERLRLG